MTKKETQFVNPSLDYAQRIAIKSLTSTLTKLINEDEISQFYIEEFIPSRENDRTIWYLDLLETQLKLTKDLVVDLKEYQDSIQDNRGYDTNKHLKATYLELSSNTKFASSQVDAISNIFYLVKADLQNKVQQNNENKIEYEPQDRKSTEDLRVLSDQLSNQMAYQQPLVDGNILRELELVKNELNLAKKVRNTLEKQLQEYRKQQVNVCNKNL